MTLRNVRNMRAAQATMDFGPQAGFDFGGQAGFDYTPPDADWFRAETEAAAKRRAQREADAAAARAAEAKRQADKARAEAERERKAQEDAQERARQRRRERESASGPDPYTILGVSRDASRSDIRKAWAKLCREHHPDVGGDVDKLKAINRAYEALKGRV